MAPSPRPLRRRVFRWLLAGLALALLMLVESTSWLASLGSTPRSGERLAHVLGSSHQKEGKFRNPVPTQTMIDGGMWTTVKRQLGGDEVREPPAPLPVVPRTRSDYDTPPPSGLRATWIGHASVLVEVDGRRVLTDPMFSERASPSRLLGPRRFHPPPIALADLPEIHAVVISHDHYDHLDMATVKALAARGTRFAVPLGIGAHLDAWKVPAAQIVELDWNQETKVGDLTLTATPARHYSNRFVRLDRTLWASWVISGPSHKVFFSGDSGYFDGFRAVGEKHGPFDLTLVKIGAYGETWPEIHMTPEEAVKTHVDLRGRLLLPIHWGTFNLAFHNWNEPPDRAIAAAKAQGVLLAMPRPGEWIEPSAPPPVETWWK